MSNLTNRFEEHVGSAVERNAVLWLTNISHAVNHFQNQMVAVLYVVIMPELGFGYAELGVVTAVMSLMGGMTQGLYGFATPFVPRAWLLGIGNIGHRMGWILRRICRTPGGISYWRERSTPSRIESFSGLLPSNTRHCISVKHEYLEYR